MSKKSKKKLPKSPLRFVDDKLFQMADAHAEAALYLTATSNAENVEEECDVLDRLAQASSYYKKEEYEVTPGGMQNTCYAAGIAFGLAFGLRLRGVR